MPYKKFLFVEDGSVDIDDLEDSLFDDDNTDIKIVVYRQGSTKPELIDIYNEKEKPYVDLINSEINSLKRKNKAIKKNVIANIKKILEKCVSLDNYNYITNKKEYQVIYNGTKEDLLKEILEKINKDDGNDE